MISATGIRKKFILLVSSCLLQLLLAPVCTSAYAGEFTLPFGIRHYDIGAAPNFLLQDIDGEEFEFKDTQGHWVFLHFWASWCGPCIKEMPAIQSMANKLAGDKFQIVMVNTAEDEDTVFTFLGSLDIELNSLMDTDGQVSEVWKPRGLPTSFLINPQGNVKYQAFGGREWNSPEYIGFLKQLISSTGNHESGDPGQRKIPDD